MVQIKMRGRKTPPQVRFKTTLEDLRRYPRIAERWGYTEFSKFARALIEAANEADPAGGVIRFTPPYARRAA